MAHFEERQKALEGKAMIVCMSRRICIDLYQELTRLRPDWHDNDDDKGAHQGSDDRLSLRPCGMATTHKEQAAAGSNGQALP